MNNKELFPMLLGRDPTVEGDWGDLRVALLSRLQGQSLIRAFAYIGSAIIAALWIAPVIEARIIALWTFAAVCISLWSHYYVLRVIRWDDPSSHADCFARFHRLAAIQALLWSVVYLLPGGAYPADKLLILWGINVVVSVASTMVLYPTPLASILFTLVTGIASAAAFAFSGLPLMSIVAVTLAVAVSLASLSLGMLHVRYRVVESQLDEKGKTVSLLLREFEDASADWLWQIDRNRCLEFVSPRLAHAMGSTTDALEGQPLLSMLAGGETGGKIPPALQELADRLRSRDSFADLIVEVKIDGQARWWELSASPRFDDLGAFEGFRGVGSDVTIERETAEKISKLAHYDDLTALPNRANMHTALSLALDEAGASNTCCALMIIDLDRFKAVNDTLGHPVGDKLLAQVAERLRTVMAGKHICGRLGGDEFAVVMRNVSSPKVIEKLAERLIESISRGYEVNGHTLYVGASVGYAMGPSEGKSVETLTRNADLALYKAKGNGGNCVQRYDPEMHALAEENRQIEIELRSALGRGELELHYQPVVNAKDAMLEGFEALLRWRSSVLGPVSPAKFIPIAEDARLINVIGAWALRKACEEAVQWPSNMTVAVNVSAEQLCDPGFASTVVSALAQSGLPARRLTIEVTESVFMRDGTHATEVLDRLHNLGVQLSLDDFGTGYSSLGYLRKVKFNTIKVDRSFVTGAAKGVAESIAVVRAVVALAESLGMTTVAEGAETLEEVETLRALGCSKIQGYFYSKPMPPVDVEALFFGQSTTREYRRPMRAGQGKR